MKNKNIKENIEYNNHYDEDKSVFTLPTIGQRIRACRITKNLSIEEFAAKLGKSYEYVVAYENNRRNPKEETLEQMANILGTSKNYLKYGFVKRSFISEDKMYEFEYRDKPLYNRDKDNTDKLIKQINKNIDVIKKNRPDTYVDYLQVIADISEYLAKESSEDDPNIRIK